MRKKVKFYKTVSGPDATYYPGDEVDLPSFEADAMVDAGAARYVGAAIEEARTAPRENASAGRRSKRRKKIVKPRD